ncbi:MAG: hypothetical protein JKP97_19920 [Rhodobacteraceae bacterium]|nr:hypothetical protein [Paracoccaceae bacterium]
MSRFALKEETEAFAAEVAKLTVPRYASHWRDRVERLWDDVWKRGIEERTASTQKLYASKFRTAVRNALEEEEQRTKRRQRVEAAVLSIVRIDPAITAKLQEDYQAKVKAENADLVLVPEWEWLVKTFEAMLEDDDMELRALAIMALTGRRFAEVLQAGEFEPFVEHSSSGTVRQKWLLKFSGQLKTKSGPETMFGKSYAIPTLAPARDVLSAFRGMRASAAGRIWKSAPERQLSTTFNPDFNRKLRTCPAAKFWPKDQPLSLKELRALYAEIAYVNFAPRTTRAPFYARILGHGDEDLTTALSYMRYSLSRQAMKEGQEEMNRLTLLREKRREDAIAAKQADEDLIEP